MEIDARPGSIRVRLWTEVLNTTNSLLAERTELILLHFPTSVTKKTELSVF